MSGEIRFEVRGLPVPQGALKVGMAGGRAHLFNRGGGALKDWRGSVNSVAQGHAPPAPWDGPVAVSLAFGLVKPASVRDHAGLGKKRHPIPVWPSRRPDLDKLVRAVLDALTGVIWLDDSQVVRLAASKDYGVPGVAVVVSRVEAESAGSSTMPPSP